MRFLKILSIAVLLFSFQSASAQSDSSQNTKKQFVVSRFTIEPGIGIHPYPISDFLVTNLMQWNLHKHLAVISHTSYDRNNAFLRNFNYIKTNYNFSVAQRFGLGTTLYTKRSVHTFSLMTGIKFDTYKETLENPDFEKVSVSMHSLSPDFGLMYNLKLGQKKYFFSYRMYLPLYPYPFKSFDINAVDGNVATISMEFGLGIRLK